jgi:hypothetical protein
VLKLKSIDKEHTKLTVVALKPFVYNNPEAIGIMRCNCGIFPLKGTDVEATTIEEYALLLFIANSLGDKTVEPLKMPGPITKINGKQPEFAVMAAKE